MGEEKTMAKNNETVDRIQAIWNMIGGDDVVDRLIAGTARLTVETTRRLSALTLLVRTAEERKVHDFFKIRTGLWVSDDFKRLILDAAQTCVLRAHEATLGYADLVEPANDAEIGGELPKSHVFTDVNVFLVRLAALIEAQWMNEDKGPLLNTKYRANIFYVKIGKTVFAVDVNWYGDSGTWFCFAYEPNSIRWNAGYRAFSATGA